MLYPLTLRLTFPGLSPQRPPAPAIPLYITLGGQKAITPALSVAKGILIPSCTIEISWKAARIIGQF